MSMTLGAARAAIEAILAAIPDSELPILKVEEESRGPVAWYGSTGFHLGSATTDGVRDSTVHRRIGATDAIVREAVYRLDLNYNPTDRTDQEQP